MMNCEFKRNIWLEFTPARLIITPVIVIAIITIAFLSNNSMYNFFDSLKHISGTFLFFTLILWGMKQASESISSEVKERTWVFQRMSSVSAWDMTIGKLFGSSAYAWYFSGFFLLTYVISAFQVEKTIVSLKFIVLFVLMAVTGQSLSMLVSLITLNNNKLTTRSTRNPIYLFGVGVAIFALFVSLSFIGNESIKISWFYWEIKGIDFVLYTAIFATSWSIIGLYRMMRSELQYDNGPIVWIVFVLSLMLYVSGLSWGISDNSTSFHGNYILWNNFLLVVVLTYMTISTESFDTVLIRKIFNFARINKWNEVINMIPLWIPTLAITIILAFSLIVHDLIFGYSFFLTNQTMFAKEVPITLIPVTVLLFLFRDLGVIGVFKSSGSSKKDFYIVTYLIFFYVLAPVIILLSENLAILHFFWPVPKDSFVWQIIPTGIQLFLVIYYIRNKHKQLANKK